MESGDQGRETRDQKRTARLRVGGNGSGSVKIEGVLVWGGTLALVSLMALFTVRSKKSVSSRCPSRPEKLKIKATEEGEGDENGGLLVVLQDPTSPTSPLTPRNSSCCTGGSYGGSSRTDLAHLDCCDSSSGQSSTSEEKPAIEKDEEKEPRQDTVFSDGTKTESVTSFGDYLMVEDGSAPATQDCALATDDWNGSTENHPEKQIIHASSEVDAFDHVADEELMAEELNDWNGSTENHLEQQIIHARSEVDAFDHVAHEEPMAEEHNDCNGSTENHREQQIIHARSEVDAFDHVAHEEPMAEEHNDWNGSKENHCEQQIIHVLSDVDAFDDVTNEELMAEEHESADSVEEEDGGDGDDDQEEVEGSSEESGGSCLELNNEAIWPLELVDEGVKNVIEDRVDMTKINKQENNSTIHNVGHNASEIHGDLAALPVNRSEDPVMGNCRTTCFAKPPIWIGYVLLLLILLSALVYSGSIRSLPIKKSDLLAK